MDWETPCSTARRWLSDGSCRSGTRALTKLVRCTSVLRCFREGEPQCGRPQEEPDSDLWLLYTRAITDIDNSIAHAECYAMCSEDSHSYIGNKGTCSTSNCTFEIAPGSVTDFKV